MIIIIYLITLRLTEYQIKYLSVIKNMKFNVKLMVIGVQYMVCEAAMPTFTPNQISR